MDDLPFPEEFDDVVDVGIVGKPQNVVIGYSCLLLWHAAKLTTIKNTNFEDNRLVSAILLLKFLHFVNSGLNGQVYIVVKIYEKTRVTIHKEKASATSPKQCRIGMGQPYQKSLKAAGIPQWLSLLEGGKHMKCLRKHPWGKNVGTGSLYGVCSEQPTEHFCITAALPHRIYTCFPRKQSKYIIGLFPIQHRIKHKTNIILKTLDGCDSLKSKE